MLMERKLPVQIQWTSNIFCHPAHDDEQWLLQQQQQYSNTEQQQQQRQQHFVCINICQVYNTSYSSKIPGISGPGGTTRL